MNEPFDEQQRELLYQAYREAGMVTRKAQREVDLWNDTSKTRQLVEFVKLPGKLRIILLPGKYDEAEEIIHSEKPWMHKYGEIIEWQKCNGWDWVDTSQLAMWDSNRQLLTDDMSEDDHGNITRLDVGYTYDLYAIRDELEVLLREGYVDYTEVDLSEDEEDEG